MTQSAAPFVWYELMTTDLKAAAAFYSAVIGWRTRDAGLSEFTYLLAMMGEAQIAGLMEVPKDCGGPGWIGHVGSRDLDGDIVRIRQLGGEVHKGPVVIPNGVGRFAVATDPAGADFMLFEPGGEMETPRLAPGAPGSCGWRELHSRDWEKAFAFYAALFGWEKSTALPMGERGVYQLFKGNGADMGGMMNLMPQDVQQNIPPHWNFYFNVADIHAAAATIAAQGGSVLMGPHPVPGGSLILQGRDPQGAFFALAQPPR